MANSIFLFPFGSTTGVVGPFLVSGSSPLIQLGGTSSSFVAIKGSGGVLQARLADDSADAPFSAARINTSIGFAMLGFLTFSTTVPTINSGFGTSPSVANANGTAAFIINVGTGGTANQGVITMPAATNGWIAMCNDITSSSTNTGLSTVQIASTTTSITIQSQNSAGAATAWATGSLVRIIAVGY